MWNCNKCTGDSIYDGSFETFCNIDVVAEDKTWNEVINQMESLIRNLDKRLSKKIEHANGLQGEIETYNAEKKIEVDGLSRIHGLAIDLLEQEHDGEKKILENKLDLSKQRLEILESKEDKTQEYIDRIHQLETDLAVSEAYHSKWMDAYSKQEEENKLLNKRIDDLIKLKITPQEIKVIKGSDVKVIK